MASQPGANRNVTSKEVRSKWTIREIERTLKGKEVMAKARRSKGDQSGIGMAYHEPKRPEVSTKLAKQNENRLEVSSK